MAGGLIGFGSLWLVGEGFRRATGKVGLGGGDPKLFGAIGLWCGALQLPLIMLVACGIGLTDAGLRPDYVHICNRATLQLAQPADHDLIVLAAVYAGTTRLIDNIFVRTAA